MSVKVLSLFSGCGGFDLGLEMAGAKTVFGCDIFKDAAETFKLNFPEAEVLLQDIRKMTEFPEADIIIGGYPCQGFSLAGNRVVDDPRNFLYKEYIRALTTVKPKFFIAENVKGLLTMDKGRVLQAMLDEFKESGYKVCHKLLNSSRYGVSQDRERVFIIGVREDLDYTYEFPVETHGVEGSPIKTMRDSISDIVFNEEDMDQTGYSPRFLSRNRKRDWDMPSFTIQASGRQTPIHPSGEKMLKISKDEWIFQGEVNRKMTYLECAAIQSFPKEFVFVGNLGNKYKMIGNAVPPLLAMVISEPIVEFLKKYKQ